MIVKEFGKYVSVYDNRNDEYSDEKVEISWASIGAVSVSETRKFVADLMSAVEYAKKLKN